MRPARSHSILCSRSRGGRRIYRVKVRRVDGGGEKIEKLSAIREVIFDLIPEKRDIIHKNMSVLSCILSCFLWFGRTTALPLFEVVCRQKK